MVRDPLDPDPVTVPEVSRFEACVELVLELEAAVGCFTVGRRHEAGGRRLEFFGRQSLQRGGEALSRELDPASRRVGGNECIDRWVVHGCVDPRDTGRSLLTRIAEREAGSGRTRRGKAVHGIGEEPRSRFLTTESSKAASTADSTFGGVGTTGRHQRADRILASRDLITARQETRNECQGVDCSYRHDRFLSPRGCMGSRCPSI